MAKQLDTHVKETQLQQQQMREETAQHFATVNSNINKIASSQVELERRCEALGFQFSKVHEEFTAMKQPGSVMHNLRSSTFRFFNVPKMPDAAAAAPGVASSSSSSSDSSRLPSWKHAMHGAQFVDEAVRATISNMSPGVPLPNRLFTNATSWQYSKAAVAADSSKGDRQMVVLTLSDPSLRMALFAAASKLKEAFHLTFTTEWTLAEKQARRQIEASPVFQRALKQASAQGKKAVWDFGTCTFGRRTADSTVWSVEYLAKLGEAAAQQVVV
jgi:hypothetical protein